VERRFEYLARRLRTPTVVENDPAIQAALTIWAPCHRARCRSFAALDPLGTLMEGALVNLNYQPFPARCWVAGNLETVVNAPNAQSPPVDPAVAISGST